MGENFVESNEKQHLHSKGNSFRETEYSNAILYIFHMYDTRHHIFKFVIGINTAMIAIVFQYLSSDFTKFIFSLIGCITTLSLTLMAKRSFRYLLNLEEYAKKLERELNLSLLNEPSSKMPKGWDSSVYLFVVYYFLVIIWFLLAVYFLLRLLFPELPKL